MHCGEDGSHSHVVSLTLFSKLEAYCFLSLTVDVEAEDGIFVVH